MTPVVFIWIVVGGALAHPLLLRLLAEGVHKRRLTLAAIGGRLEDDARLDPARRRALVVMVDSAFSPWSVWALAAGTLTMTAGFAVRLASPPPATPPSVARRWRAAMWLHGLSVFAASPVSSILLAPLLFPVLLTVAASRIANPWEAALIAVARAHALFSGLDSATDQA